MSIEIMNLRTIKPTQPYDVKVDRSSPLGNKFYMANEVQRDVVCDQYQQWFDTTVVKEHQCAAYTELVRLYRLHLQYGKLRLFCWCAPKRCHGETIKHSINRAIAKTINK